MVRVVYHPRYNLGFPGAQRLHPFDLRKFARAWAALRKQLGSHLDLLHVSVPEPVSEEALKLVHSPEYLRALRQSGVIAQAIEVPALRRAPWWLLDRFVLQPMRWATAGTIAAGRAALESGLAFNLGGGFHHAKPARGEGFSIYNDIAVMVRTLQREQKLTENCRIAYVDLDAHLGNGVAWCFRDDPRLFHLDMHNADIYPFGDTVASERVDCSLPVRTGCLGDTYLHLLKDHLPPFLDSVGRTARIDLAIYNAGTDVLDGDPLGGLVLSLDDVLARDRFVLETLRGRNIPTVVLASGGYTSISYQAIARTIVTAIKSPLPPSKDA